MPGIETRQTRPVGRPCSTCVHSDRSAIEGALADGEAISRISETFGVSRSSLRRHRAQHMSVSFHDGIDPWTTVLRMAASADRLRDLADEAEESGRIAVAIRAVLAEAKTLDLLLALGVRGPQQLDYAADARALEGAVCELVQEMPAIGDQLAEFLRQRDRTAFAAKLRRYAEKCRELPQHQAKSQQVSGNERQELSHADI